jgi:hypothetical protein
MRPDAALADRRREVRLAARGWRRSGAIHANQLASIDAAYADDRARLGPMFRTLAFLLGMLGLNAFLGLFVLLNGGRGGTERAFATACLVLSMLLAGATELLTGPLKRADSGIETATALLFVTYAVVGLGLSLERGLPDRVLVSFLLLAAALLAGLSSRRWGSPLLAAVASVCFWALLARLPGGRVLWLVVSPALAPLLLRRSTGPTLPPVHRRSCLAGLVLAVCAFYVAVHVGSWDYRWLERIADFDANPAPGFHFLRPLSILATAAMPVAVIAFGIASRRALLLNLGILLGVASLLTLRFYVHVAPAWVVLMGSGAAALLAAVWLRRYLAGGPNGERAGFTAEPLFEDPTRRHAGEIVGALATFTPGARALPADSGLKPGGGRFGGGGATSDF